MKSVKIDIKLDIFKHWDALSTVAWFIYGRYDRTGREPVWVCAVHDRMHDAIAVRKTGRK